MMQTAYDDGAVDGAPSPTTRRSSYDDSVLGKVHLLLEAFTPEAPCLGLTALSRKSGVPKATVYRLADQLVSLGYLAKTTKGYQLGWRLFEIGRIVPGPSDLATAARPILIDLRTSTNAALVHLSIARGTDVVYLERLAGQRESRLLSAVPQAPALDTATGRVLLAYGAAILDLAEIRERGTDLAQFRDELNLIRSRRWAMESGAFVPGTKTIAVPLLQSGSMQVIAALSVTVAQGRRDDRNILHALWLAANEIGKVSHRTRPPAAVRARLA